MTVIVMVSAKGSPGVTTSALALAAVWPRRLLLVECDLAGGDLAAGFLRATAPTTGGLLELALAARRGISAHDVIAHGVPLSSDDSVLLLAGVTDPRHGPAVSSAWPQIAAAMRALNTAEPAYDVLVDAGRLPCPDELLAVADRVVLVTRPTLVGVSQASRQLPGLRRRRPSDEPDLVDGDLDPTGAADLGVLLIGDRPYSPSEVRSALAVPVTAVLAHDSRAATALSEGAASGRWFDRSPLMRTARCATAALAAGSAAHDPTSGLLASTASTSPRGQHIGLHPDGAPAPGASAADRRVAP